MYKMGLPEVIIWAWEVKGLVMSSCDDLTYVKHPSTELILHVLNRSSVIGEDRDMHSFLQLKTLSSFPDASLSLKKSTDL